MTNQQCFTSSRNLLKVTQLRDRVERMVKYLEEFKLLISSCAFYHCAATACL